MTLGFAGAAWTDNDDRLVVVAADTRLSSEGNVLTDAGVKTYELGGRSALVASGHALPPMMAAEFTRSLIENHSRRTPERPVNFVDTVRLLGFFLKRAAAQQGGSLEHHDSAKPSGDLPESTGLRTSNFAFDRTAGSHSLAAAGQCAR